MKRFLLFLFVLTVQNLSAQISRATINYESIIFPNLSTTQRNALTPSQGQCLYNTDTKSLECFNGTKWLTMGDSFWRRINDGINYGGGYVGVNNPNPFAPLSVTQDSSFISPNTLTALADFQRTYQGSTARFLIYGYPDTDNVLPHLRKSVMLYATSDARDMVLNATQADGRIRFFTQTWTEPTNERMVIDQIGNVGIGTTKPEARLQIKSGDIYLEDNNAGVIRKSPDGNCWKTTVSNTGSLITSSVTCPETHTNLRNDEKKIREKLENPTEVMRFEEGAGKLNQLPRLDQNVPNPYRSSTTIPYFLPANTSKAKIIITDSEGKMIETIEVKGEGDGSVEVQLEQSTTGIYYYSLEVNGKLVETKKMSSL